MAKKTRSEMRIVRHVRIRKRVEGVPEQPRLAVFRSLKHISAQIIDDTKGHTLCSASSVEKSLSAKGNQTGAKIIGQTLAKRALDQGIKKVVFDRGGYQYHGCVASLAEAARETGLEF